MGVGRGDQRAPPAGPEVQRSKSRVPPYDLLGNGSGTAPNTSWAAGYEAWMHDAFAMIRETREPAWPARAHVDGLSQGLALSSPAEAQPVNRASAIRASARGCRRHFVPSLWGASSRAFHSIPATPLPLRPHFGTQAPIAICRAETKNGGQRYCHHHRLRKQRAHAPRLVGPRVSTATVGFGLQPADGRRR